jgi:hypothetical protein
MKRLVLIIGVLILAAVPLHAAGSLFWVVGNRATQRCDIVTRNPVIDGLAALNGGYWFGDGPYRSRDDAKLARSTIAICPQEPPEDGK